MDTNRFAVGVLSITATILLVGVILLSATRPVSAVGMNMRGGDYVMTTVQQSQANEYLLVTDARTHRMVLYNYNVTRHQLEPIAAQEISQLVQQGARRTRP